MNPQQPRSIEPTGDTSDLESSEESFDHYLAARALTDHLADHDRTGLDGLAAIDHPARDAAPFRRILDARERLAAAEQELRDAFRASRDAGDSWTVIGAALDTTRQAAQQRFGD